MKFAIRSIVLFFSLFCSCFFLFFFLNTISLLYNVRRKCVHILRCNVRYINATLVDCQVFDKGDREIRHGNSVPPARERAQSCTYGTYIFVFFSILFSILFFCGRRAMSKKICVDGEKSNILPFFGLRYDPCYVRIYITNAEICLFFFFT